MATVSNGLTNGHHDASPEPYGKSQRFSDIPSQIEIPISGGEIAEAVEVDLEVLLDDPTELCTLLENESVGKSYWTTIALAYAKQGKIDHAIEILNKALGALGSTSDRLGLYNCLCWLYFWKSRDAPRMVSDGANDSDLKTKDFYYKAALNTINDASRLSPSYPPLYLARGILNLLRAPLVAATDRSELLRQAIKAFDDAARTSGGRNIMAILGRSRALFSLSRFPEALQGYQQVLERAPDQVDPDPRIGIGCCFWALGHKDEAQGAWQRALEINPDSKVANILLGLYHLSSCSQYSTTDPKFAPIYKKAMVQYTQKAFKLDSDLPLACATFGGYFLVRKAWPTVETLARKALERTDISAIASDGWYLLARKEHYNGDYAKASEYYTNADRARGGDTGGYLPAKFGSAQLKVLQQDLAGAKFQLEKIIQQTKNIEAMTLLGSLFAEDAFSAQDAGLKEEQALAARKAIPLLEAVRVSWRDPKKNLTPDSTVLSNLARLYEIDAPEKSLQCLQQVEQMELDELPEDLKPDNMEDAEAARAAMRAHLSPHLLNNMGCFHYQADRLKQAEDLFQAGLKACINVGDKEEGLDTDALVTTISYNLARAYEAQNMLDDAKTVYEGLLVRHGDYTDANARLTYIALRQSPTDDGPKAMGKLYEAESTNLEVRALYGWFLRKAKRRTTNAAEDQEQRHYKHTLQNHDKHDRYSLVGMGNLYLSTAREMARNTDQERDKKRKMYERSIEFFDKALQLDPRNAYAAQGIGIAMAEDKKDFAAALQIFSKVRETVKDSSVLINLGHVFCEVKQYSRAIECYEGALAKDRTRDPQVLACLGKTWLLRGKQERSAQAMKTSLDYSHRAQQVAPDQVHFRFNVAFVQIQLAQLVYSLPETQRTLEDVEAAAVGLDEAVESFSAIAKSPNPPFPRHDLEQRANMGRNTMRKQLERAIQTQREYQEKNETRLQQAKQQRDAEIAKRAEEKRKLEESAHEQRKKIAEERRIMQERDRMLADQREEEEKRKEEDFSVDEETGEKKKKPKRPSGKRKKKGVENGDSDLEGSDKGFGDSTPAASDGEKIRKKKKRKLERASKSSSKYKSSEFVVESDEDDGDQIGDAAGGDEEENDLFGDTTMADASDSDAEVEATTRRRPVKRVLDDDDSDAELAAGTMGAGTTGAAGEDDDDE